MRPAEETTKGWDAHYKDSAVGRPVQKGIATGSQANQNAETLSTA